MASKQLATTRKRLFRYDTATTRQTRQGRQNRPGDHWRSPTTESRNDIQVGTARYQGRPTQDRMHWWWTANEPRMDQRVFLGSQNLGQQFATARDRLLTPPAGRRSASGLWDLRLRVVCPHLEMDKLRFAFGVR